MSAPANQQSRLRQLPGKAWGIVVSCWQGGRSLVSSVLPFGKTAEMEAAIRPSAKRLASVSSLSDSDTSTISTTNDSSSSASTTIELPQGPRWAICHPDTDFTGTWAPVVDAAFKNEYGTYLENCGTTFMFRQVCLNFAHTTRERIDQEEQGRILHFHAQNPAGGWKRTLVSSGADLADENFEAVHAEFLDPDKELVKVEAWWEEQGTVHKSWLRNKPGVDGGAFESTRYLEESEASGEVELICESIFHPAEKDRNNPSSKFKPAFVRWRYRRE